MSRCRRESGAGQGRQPLPGGLGAVGLFNCVTLNLPRVPACVSEALVLRTYPLKEADLIVSFLTRDRGKLRGVAKRARRPKSGFGAGLERLSHVRMAYFQRETRELVNLDSVELIRSQFDLVSDYCLPRSRARGFSGFCWRCSIRFGRPAGTIRRRRRRGPAVACGAR
jgi:hypothetical protein